MRLNVSLLVSTAVILFLANACQTTSSTDIGADNSGQAPTATPVPPEAMRAAQDFARSHGQIEAEWDQFHTDFDQWRSGLSSCDRTAAQIALRGFTADLGDVRRRVSDLPRSSSTRSLADQLIEAVEKEEVALRHLRDRWQPDATSLLDAVNREQSASIAAQQEVADELTSLRESSGTSALDDAREFSSAFAPLKGDWETLHDAYDSLKDEQDTLSAEDSSARLGELIEDLDSIRSDIDDLPSSSTTREMISRLKAAADAEKTALSSLQEDFNGQSNGNGNISFSDADDKVNRSNSARDQVDEDLEGILEDSSSQEVGDIDAFRQAFDAVSDDWRAFHDRYHQWMRTEGGCDRREVVNALEGFQSQLGNLSRRVNNLPQAAFLKQMNESLAEAVERESEALRELRNTWRPFATDSYRAFDQERSNAGKLRRQTDLAVQELLDKFGISSADI